VILETALEKDRSRRSATALDFAEDLRRLPEREPIRARPAGPLLRLTRWTQRKPALAASVLGIFALLVTALTLTTWFLRQKAVDLAEVTRLGDLARLRDLFTRAEQLRPAVPENVHGKAGMSAWLGEARALIERRAVHLATLDRVRARSDPSGRGAAAAFASRNAALRRELAAFTKMRAKVESLHHEGRDRLLARIDEEVGDAEGKLCELLAWTSDDPRDTWLYGTLVELNFTLRRLERAAADMESRRAFALTVDQRSIADHRADWERVIAEIADPELCPRYRGLRIRPQRGLVPLGRDPRSGLHEFAHLETGTLARRNPETGALRIGFDEGLVFVLIPPGKFRMGAERSGAASSSAPNVDPFAQPRDGPVHEVALAAFFLSKFEMTQGQWLRVTGEHPSQFGPGRRMPDGIGGFARTHALSHPVEGVDWADCDSVLAKIGLLLPTEAQWEYGARGDTSTVFWTGDSKETLSGACNLADRFCRANGGPPGFPYEDADDGYAFHAPVGSFRPNPFGLHDTAGKLLEWCRDWFGP
jgi:formylglycine-generating enzyme required for sulfatase activity